MANDNSASGDIAFMGWKTMWFLLGTIVIGSLYVIIPEAMPLVGWTTALGKVLSGHVWLDVLFLVVIVVGSIQLAVLKSAIDKFILIGEGALVLFVFCSPADRFVNWPGGLSWKWILIAVFLAAIKLKCNILFSGKSSEDFSNRSVRLNPAQGLVQKTDMDQLLDCGWDNYISIICERICNTSIKKENIAIGIVGNWGVGKSTFLERLQENLILQADFQIMRFNAWQCPTPNDVVKDFFSQLAATVGVAGFEDDINQYLQLVGDFDQTGISRLISGLVSSPTPETIDELKEKLNLRLEQNHLPTIILIDDIDRMQVGELMELLKLIRVTANLSNIVIIAAYDKHYLTHLLDNSGFRDGREYLRKIFHIEMPLPAPGISNIAELMCREIAAHSDNQKFCNDTCEALQSLLKGGNGPVLSCFIKNFRDSKVLTNALLVAARLIEMSGIGGEILYGQLFWVEVLRLFDIDTYEKLKNRPGEILRTGKFGIGGYRYIYARAKSDDEASTGENQWATDFVLQRLFPEADSMHLFAIQRYNNYYKYFNYSIFSSEVSVANFKDLINNIDLEATRKKASEIIGKDQIKSLLSQIACLKIEECDDSLKPLALNFLVVLIEIANHSSDEALPAIFRNLLDASRCKIQMADEVKGLLLRNIGEFGGNCFVWNSIFAALYSVDVYYNDQESLSSYSSIIDNATLEQLCNLNCKAHLSKNEGIKIQSIPDPSHPFNKFVKNACVVEALNSYDNYDDAPIKRSLIFDALKEHFGGGVEEKDYNEFLDFFACHADDDYVDEWEWIENSKARLFGSADKYNEFVVACKPHIS